MRRDAAIAEAIVRSLAGDGIPCLPIHDSFLVPSKTRRIWTLRCAGFTAKKLAKIRSSKRPRESGQKMRISAALRGNGTHMGECLGRSLPRGASRWCWCCFNVILDSKTRAAEILGRGLAAGVYPSSYAGARRPSSNTPSRHGFHRGMRAIYWLEMQFGMVATS